ncbi:MAG: sugar ABC transporter permease [Chloroflexia bacterium]
MERRPSLKSRQLDEPASLSAAADRRPLAALQVGRPSRYRFGLYWMLVPYLLGTLLLVAVPAALTFGLAFTQYDALSAPTWRGLANFDTIIHERLFRVAVQNSLYFVALAVPLRTLGALGLALLLNHRRRGVGIYRVSAYLPTVIPDVAYALIWLWIFNPVYGPLNIVLGMAGLPTPAWLVREHGEAALVIMSLFQIGEGFIVLLAGLQEMPQDYFDAAAVDGGGRFRTFRYITLPLLAPWLVLLTLRDIIVSAQSTFTPAYLMTGGDPYYSTLFMPLLIYEEAFDRFRFGLGSAMMVVMFAGIGLLLFLVYKVLGGWGYSSDY